MVSLSLWASPSRAYRIGAVKGPGNELGFARYRVLVLRIWCVERKEGESEHLIEIPGEQGLLCMFKVQT